MKKVLLILACCMCLCGCGNKEEIEALKGTWVRDKLEYIGLNVEYLTFEKITSLLTEKDYMVGMRKKNLWRKGSIHILEHTKLIKI